MKRFTSFLLMVLLCLSVVGCNDVDEIVTPTTTTISEVTSKLTTTTTQTETTAKEKKKQKIETSSMYIDYSFTKEFGTIEEYKKEFLTYKTFDIIKKSLGYKYYPDSIMKIDKSYCSMMLDDKYFLVLNNKELKLKQIYYRLDWAYVCYVYELDLKEVVIGYCTSKEITKNLNICKEKPDIITKTGCELYLTKRTTPQYSWYDKNIKTLFFAESEMFYDADLAKKTINSIKIEKIEIK